MRPLRRIADRLHQPSVDHAVLGVLRPSAMALFHERTEGPSGVRIRVKLSYYVVTYLVVVLTLALVFFMGSPETPARSLVLTAGIGLMLTRLFAMRRVQSEIRRSMKDRNLEITGSSFDFRRPLQYDLTAEGLTAEGLTAEGAHEAPAREA